MKTSTKDRADQLKLLSEADLDKITGGSNGNPTPGLGTYTAVDAYGYGDSRGYPGYPHHSNSDKAVGTFNATLQSGQNPGSGSLFT